MFKCLTRFCKDEKVGKSFLKINLLNFSLTISTLLLFNNYNHFSVNYMKQQAINTIGKVQTPISVIKSLLNNCDVFKRNNDIFL